MTQRSLIRMQISPIKNPNFEKPSRNRSNRTKMKILKKKFFWISLTKIWFRVCSVTAEMFEHRNSGENRRKRSEFFFENLRRHIMIWFRSKKNSKLSHACVPLRILCCLGAVLPLKGRIGIPLNSIVLFCGTGFPLKVRMRVPLMGNMLLCNRAPSET